MRPFIGMCWLCIFLNQDQLVAQDKPNFCGWAGVLQETENRNSTPCFDVGDIFKNCKTIYIRINLHFFVNDNCDGKVQQTDKNQNEIYKTAEEMIHFANAFFANNEAQWQYPNAVVPCIPIRLVLKGIHIHCKSEAIGIYNATQLNEKFGVNKSTEINFYIADTEDGATGIGYHNERCGSATSFNKEIWWTIGNFTHELGHILSLQHSFEPDGCDDTPRIVYSWDKNCNGIFEYSNDMELNEVNLTCWNKLEANKKPGEIGYSDINKNNVNDCDEQLPCKPCPCCQQEYIDNNIMSYSATKSALTECQINKMLTDLSGYNCNLIEKIGDCPPASAFITQTPEDIKNQTRCGECLILEASMNDDEYELKIFEQINGNEILAYNSGWKTGPAVNFCYRTGINTNGSSNYLKPNTHYIAYLKIRNTCSESNCSYHFMTNISDCGSLPYLSVDISPNPVIHAILVSLIVNESNEHIQVIAKNMITGISYNLISNQTITNGMNQLNLDLVSLPQGTYTLILLGDHAIYQNNFVKL